MLFRSARALGVPEDCTSVKATTTERMGFEGEELGISAQATALLTRAAAEASEYAELVQ